MEKTKAEQKAKELAEQMGEGWSSNVWYNLHWCYDVSKETVHIAFSLKNYRAYYMSNSIVVGKGETPQEALTDLKAQYKDYYERVKAYWKMLKEIE